MMPLLDLDNIRRFINKERFFFWLLAAVMLLHAAVTVLEEASPSGTAADGQITDAARQDPDAGLREIEQKLSGNPAYYFRFAGILSLALLAMVAGIFIDVLFFARWRFASIMTGRRRAAVPWGMWDVCKVVIVFLFFQYLFIFAHAFVRDLGLFPRAGEYALSVFFATLLDLVLVLTVIYLVKSFHKSDLGALGLTTRNFAKNLRYGIISYVGLIPIIIAILVTVLWLSRAFNITLKPQTIVEIFKEEKQLGFLMYMTVFAGIFGPVVEEIFFRGFLYGALKKRIGIAGGIALSALLFAFLHANLASFFPILALGVLLAYVYERSGSLVTSLTVHMMHNCVMLILVFATKGLYA